MLLFFFFFLTMLNQSLPNMGAFKVVRNQHRDESGRNRSQDSSYCLDGGHGLEAAAGPPIPTAADVQYQHIRHLLCILAASRPEERMWRKHERARSPGNDLPPFVGRSE